MNLEERIRTAPETVNWRALARMIDRRPDEFIIEHIHQIDWDLAPAHYNFSEHVVRATQDHINWLHVSMRTGALSDAFLSEFADRLDWTMMSLYIALSEELIQENWTRFDSWYGISSQTHSAEFIRTFAEQLIWNQLATTTLPAEILIECFDRINNWKAICSKAIANDSIEAIMQKDPSVLDWSLLCEYSNLSEEIISKYLFYMDWDAYSQHNLHVIPRMIYEHKDRCDLENARVQQLIEMHQEYLEQLQAMDEALNGIIPNEIINVVADYM